MRKLILPLVSSVFLAGAAFATDTASSPPVVAETQPDATLNLTGGSVAAGIGYTWGSGDVTYHGSAHRFKINGVSIVDVGATSITATGDVYNLTKLSDFAGNYVAVSAGIAIAGGASGTYLKNEHGVVIKLRSTDMGLKFSLAADGVSVTLKS